MKPANTNSLLVMVLVDSLVLAYLAFGGYIAARLGHFYPLVPLHLVAALLLLWFSRRGSRLEHFLHGVVSFVIIGFAYWELDVLSEVAGGHLYDDLVMGWETRVFGVSPALWLCESLPSYWFSEFLHFSYACFYVLAYALAIRLFLSERFGSAHQFMTALIPATLACYLIIIFFPVAGPREIFPPLPEPLCGPWWEFCHRMCGWGAAAAAAFPSIHATHGTVVAISAYRWERFWPPFCLIGAGIVMATVYGRFHYALDTLLGMSLAILSGIVVPRLQRATQNRIARSAVAVGMP